MDDITMMLVSYQKMRLEGKVFNEYEYLLYEQLCRVMKMRLEHDLEQIERAIAGLKKESNDDDDDKGSEDTDAHGVAQPT